MSESIVPVIRVLRKRTFPSIPGIVLTVKKSKGSDGKAIVSSNDQLESENVSSDVKETVTIPEQAYFKLFKSSEISEIKDAGVLDNMDVEIALIDYNSKKSKIDALGNSELTPTELLKQFSDLKAIEKNNDKGEPENVDIIYDYYIMNDKNGKTNFSSEDIEECNLREATYDEIQLYYGSESDSDNDKKLTGYDESDDSNDEDNWRNEYPDESMFSSEGSDSDDEFNVYSSDDRCDNFNYYTDNSFEHYNPSDVDE
uniref:Probable RNA polymerase II nuclear localization protein SLC7A6OS n=1 Tax=Parastrongyloides trichosuri TaxID=131310 RepID=A0A0N4ZS95_PARTI